MKWIKWIVIVLIITLIFVKIPTISIYSNHKIVICDIIKDNETFVIESEHSVSKTMVYESYFIRNGIINNETKYSDQGGAGMPDVLLENENFTIDLKGNFVVNRHRDLGNNIRIMVNVGSAWRFISKDHELDYNNTQETRVVSLKYKKMMLWEYMKNQIMVYYDKI